MLQEIDPDSDARLNNASTGSNVKTNEQQFSPEIDILVDDINDPNASGTLLFSPDDPSLDFDSDIKSKGQGQVVRSDENKENEVDGPMYNG